MTDLVQVQAQSAAQTAKAEAQAALEWIQANTPPRRSPGRAQTISDTLTLVAERRKAVEDARVAMKRPALDTCKAIDGYFKPAIDVFDAIKSWLATEIKHELDEDRRAQAAALTQATSPAEVKQAVAILAPLPTGVGERTTYHGEVVDETQLPRRYWVIDQAAIDRDVRAAKGKIEIPGVRVVVDTQVVRR